MTTLIRLTARGGTPHGRIGPAETAASWSIAHIVPGNSGAPVPGYIRVVPGIERAAMEAVDLCDLHDARLQIRATDIFLEGAAPWLQAHRVAVVMETCARPGLARLQEALAGVTGIAGDRIAA